MAYRTWLQGPRHPLPRRVWPVQAETVHSYTMRLAQANHLPVKVLRLYLSGTPSSEHPRSDWLAVASGYPLDLLEIRLKGLTRGHGFAEQLRRSRPACRWCMARRGIDVPVYCWLPEHRTVCFRHRRWIGAPAHRWADQRGLDHHPAVLAAARRHARIAHQHTAFATVAMRDARRILNCWWREGAAITAVPNLRDLTVDEYLPSYGDHVALAAVLANYRGRIATSSVPSDRLLDELCRQVTTVFAGRCGSSPALEQWISDQRLMLRRPTGPLTRLLGLADHAG
ncbi:TniQ family protein [Mycobacterium aquaticum]|uniref:TniQ protein n=1 Tax=Mycobacterium aquaticum TaxID=1927124 RepID=A0A1W9ZTZ6_9MYCO|nr:TniQ family protein [Mycobacterium aquaticum]ORA21254.1 hypothetical protein BST13_37815 [Mycobacterium aquaticum]